MSNIEYFHELSPTMNQFSWQCPKPRFNPPFKCEDKQSTYFIVLNNLKILLSDVKIIEMHECIGIPFTIEFQV